MVSRRVSPHPLLFRLTTVLLLAVAAASGGARFQRETAVFWFDRHPDLPLLRFLHGELGILQPTYARSYLYVAYRLMEGAPLTAEERRQTLEYWERKLEKQPAEPSMGPEDYDRLRGSLDLPWQAPERPTRRVYTYRRSPEFVYYRQCADDAFEVAARTLEERLDRFGKGSREVAEWVRGQDFVFENCFGQTAGFVPPPAPPDVDPLIQADRRYQIAAALFYSNRFEEAAGAFRRIVGEEESPWAAWGDYLAGRALLWRARAIGPDSDQYAPTLLRAAELLTAALDDPRQAAAHSAARRMLARILIRIDKPRAMTLLAGRLMSPLGAEDRAVELGQFSLLMDNTLGEPLDVLAEVMAAHDMAQWIFTFQSEADEVVVEHALERWRQSGSVAWLLAALAKIPPQHAEAEAVIEAAAEVRSHPATASLTYYRARLLAQRGEFAKPREELNELAKSLRTLPSSRNRVLDLRARVSASLADLADHLLLRPALVSYVYSLNAPPYSPWQLEREADADARRGLETLALVRRLPPGVVRVLNSVVPLRTFLELALIEDFPLHIRQKLLGAAFARAAVLGEMGIAQRVAVPLSEAVPPIAERVRAFLAATNEREQRVRAALLLVDLPGASIHLRAGPIRLPPPTYVDEQGLNWWWWEDAAAPEPPAVTPSFLTARQREQAAREWRVMALMQDGYPWLLSEALVEARRILPLPEAPELLSRALTALRPDLLADPYQSYPTAYRATPRREEAFETLQSRFPTSPWAARARQALGR